MLAFPPSPTTGQQYQQWIWDGAKWTPAPVSVPHCGFFDIVGASPSNTVSYYPWNGDLVRVNGIIYKIPAAGITAAWNNCYLNGVAGSTLALATFYYVYVFVSPSGALALDFATVARAVSSTPGNVGTVIKSGDDTRTLVGCVRTAGVSPANFYNDVNNRMTRSWFNKSAFKGTVTFTFGGSWGNNATLAVAVAVMWAGEIVQQIATCSAYSQSGGGTMTVWTTINAAQQGLPHSATISQNGVIYPLSQASASIINADGMYNIGVYGSVDVSIQVNLNFTYNYG